MISTGPRSKTGTPERRWVPFFSGPLPVHRWSDEEYAVVFHPGSGHTHLVQPIAVDVLIALGERPMAAGELALALQDRVHPDDHAAFANFVERLLLQLQQHELARPLD